MSDNKEFQTVNRSEKGKVGARNVRDKTKYNNKSSNKERKEHTEQERPRLSFKDVLYELNNLKKHLHSPKVDLRERNNLFIVRVELPGLSTSEVNVKLVDSQFLLISGNKNNTNANNDDNVVYSECHYGSFMRRVKLPTTALLNTLLVSNDNGVFTISIQKSAVSEQVPEQVSVGTGNWADEVV